MLTQDPKFSLINERFPHIGHKIEKLWGQTECNAYLTELFTDTRGTTRQGFPPDVASALFKLWQDHEDSFPGERIIVQDIWSLNNKD